MALESVPIRNGTLANAAAAKSRSWASSTMNQASARGAGADAVALDRRDGCGFQRRMLAQAEIIVAGERQQATAVALHPEIADPAGRHKRTAQVSLLQRRKLLPCEFIEGGHVFTIIA